MVAAPWTIANNHAANQTYGRYLILEKCIESKRTCFVERFAISVYALPAALVLL
jgi:hypothetical protein